MSDTLAQAAITWVAQATTVLCGPMGLQGAWNLFGRLSILKAEKSLFG